MRNILVVVTFLVAGGVSACSWNPFQVHRIDVQQGNALPHEAIDQLRVGMTAEQVRFLMGTPIASDPFRPDRWYYVYYLKPGKRPAIEQRLTITFEEGRVTRIDRPKSESGADPDLDRST